VSSLLVDTVVRGRVGKKIILKIKTKILRKLFFQKKVFLHGEKENFEVYYLILEYAELSFLFKNNYPTEKRRPCPQAIVCAIKNMFFSCHEFTLSSNYSKFFEIWPLIFNFSVE
jgi:hypothetical protein